MLSDSWPSCRDRAGSPCRAGCRPGARRRTAARAARSRTTVDSSFCAATVPSHDSGGDQAGVAVAARLRRLTEVVEQLHPAARHGLAEREHRVQVRGQPALVRGVALGRVDHAPLLHHVRQPVREPRGRGQPVAPGTAGLLVVPLDATSAGRGARRTARRACRCPCRTRWSRPSRRRPRAGTGTGCARAPAGRGPRGTAAPATPSLDQELRGLLDRVPRQAVDDAGVALVLGAQQVEQLVARLVLGRDPVLDVGPVEAGDEVLGVAELQPLRDLRVRLRRSRWRSARSAGPRASARAASTAAGSRAGSRAPTGTRSAPRRWRTGRPCRGPAARGLAHPQPLGRQVEQVQLAREVGVLDLATLERLLRRVQEPGPHAERGQRVDLVLHEGDQRRDDDARCPAGPAPAPGSRATCRRRSA